MFRKYKPGTGTPFKTTCHPHPLQSSFTHLPESQTSEPVKKKAPSQASSPPFLHSSVPVTGHKNWTDLAHSNQVVTLYHLQLTALSSHK